MNRISSMALLLSAALTAACASFGPTVEVVSQASGSASFSLGTPSVYKSGDELAIVGRVCRRSRSTLLSPSRLRLEHVSMGGQPLETAQAGLTAIYDNPDQACTDYSVRVRWRIVQGETIRACFDRGRPCPVETPANAVIAVPATAPPTP